MPTRVPFNANRSYQVAAMLPLLRQCKLGLKEHRVLGVLAARMAYQTGPHPQTIIDMCFPTIISICRDSMLADTAVRQALRNLITHGFIFKSRMPGRRLSTSKARNQFENNRYHLVPEVWDFVGPLFAPKPPVPLIEELSVSLEGVSTLSGPPDSASDEPTEDAINAVMKMLRKTFKKQCASQTPDSEKILRSCIRGCLLLVTSDEIGIAVFEWMCTDPENGSIRKSVGNATKMGGYLRTCFPGWLDSFSALHGLEEEEGDECGEDEEEGDEEEECFGADEESEETSGYDQLDD